MDFLRAVYTGDWKSLTESKELEPLELSKEEEHVVIARIKKLARDPALKFANALELVHRGYEEQEWERQSAIGDLVRPSPSDRAAWEQYEKFIQLAVKLLAKYRGIKGDWRTDRFDTVPTNQRASMGSMAAARVKEGVVIQWDSLVGLNIVCESHIANDNLFKNNCIVENTSLEAAADKIANDVSKKYPDYIVAEGNHSSNIMELYVYDAECNIVDVAVLRESNGLDVKTPSVESLAKKYNVSVDKIKRQLKKGIEVELEHSSSREVAEEIALDHLGEFLDYYERLAKMEKEAESK